MSTMSLKSDEPIRQSAKDLLDRGALVKAIAEQILATKTRQSIIIGLNAPWGAGKSSFLNLIEEHLKHAPPPNPVIMRFNPWIYGNIEQLVRMFFADLALVIGSVEDDEDRRREITDALNGLGVLLSAATSAPLPPEWAAGIAGLGTIATTIGGFLRARRAETKEGQDAYERLVQKRAIVDERLAELDHRVVVFIDDVDRLEPDLTKLLFRMVRLSANFSNMTYVLAFDRTVVEKHLFVETTISGRRYLEKIVQVSYDIPNPPPDAIPSILKAGLTDIRKTVPVNVLHDRRLSHIYDRRFADHFETLRDVNRYFNALRLTLPPLAGKVDLVDFCVIELFRLMYPEAYLAIRDNRKILVRGSSDEEQAKQWLDDLCELHIPEDLRESGKGLMRVLFPELDRVCGGDGSWGEADRLLWRDYGRVCSDVAFNRFFLLTPPADELIEADVRTLNIDGIPDNTIRAMIQKLIMRAQKTGKIQDLLAEMANAISRLRGPVAECVAEVICDLDPRDDLQLEDRHEQYELLSDIVKRWIVPRDPVAIQNDPTELHRRYVCLRRLIRNSASVFAVSNILEDMTQEDVDNAVGPGSARNLRSQLQQRIIGEATATDGAEAFWEGNRWYYILSVAWNQERMLRDGQDGGGIPESQRVLDVVRRRIGGLGDPDDERRQEANKRLIEFGESFREAVVDDMARGDSGERREKGISRWLTADAIDRLKELGEGQDECATRAKALVRHCQLGRG